MSWVDGLWRGNEFKFKFNVGCERCEAREEGLVFRLEVRFRSRMSGNLGAAKLYILPLGSVGECVKNRHVRCGTLRVCGREWESERSNELMARIITLYVMRHRGYIGRIAISAVAIATTSVTRSASLVRYLQSRLLCSDVKIDHCTGAPFTRTVQKRLHCLARNQSDVFHGRVCVPKR